GDLFQVAGVEHYFYGPRLHEFLREIRARAFEPPAVDAPKVMVGETPGIGVETGRLLTGADRGELDLIFSFDHLESGSHTRFDDYRYDLEWYKRYLVDYQSRLGPNDWVTLFFDNHDNPRMLSKVNPDPQHRVALGKLLGTLLLMMRGTPFLYQGQEIAATNEPFASLDDLRDVDSLTRYQTLVQEGLTHEEAWAKVVTSSRDHSRVPMRWGVGPHNGFTTGTPWLPGAPDPGFSVAEQADDPGSVLSHFRSLLDLRRGSKALRLGDIDVVDADRSGYFAWYRTAGEDRFFVQLNLTDQPLQTPDADPTAELAIGSHGPTETTAMAPYESRVYRCRPATQASGG
ncbi:MAG: alpha-amylase family glycosyl hydrolase, partial [Actinomycetes bacterium]